MSYNHVLTGHEAFDAVVLVLNTIGRPYTMLEPTRETSSHGEVVLRSLVSKGVVFEEYLGVDDEDCDGLSSLNVRAIPEDDAEES